MFGIVLCLSITHTLWVATSLFCVEFFFRGEMGGGGEAEGERKTRTNSGSTFSAGKKEWLDVNSFERRAFLPTLLIVLDFVWIPIIVKNVFSHYGKKLLNSLNVISLDVSLYWARLNVENTKHRRSPAASKMFKDIYRKVRRLTKI